MHFVWVQLNKRTSVWPLLPSVIVAQCYVSDIISSVMMMMMIIIRVFRVSMDLDCYLVNHLLLDLIFLIWHGSTEVHVSTLTVFVV